jgi:protein-S-isoprenylcysteine O-methyltransferase Ste14
MEVTWDPRTAATNQKKHKISFEEATTVLADPLAITGADPDHSVGDADRPGVIVRPPVLYGGALLAALLLGWLWPLRILRYSIALGLGIALLLLGLAIAIPARRTLRAAGTNVDPMRPATAIVTSGPYRYSRNPLYVALTLLYSGLTLMFDTWWGIVLLLPVLWLMHQGVVLREERYLERKFGEAYRQYRSSVRRYV